MCGFSNHIPAILLGLRKYGDYKQQIGLEKTFAEYLDKMIEIMKEIKRVVKKEGTIFVNFGDCYGGSMQGYGAKEKSKSGIQSPAGIDERYTDKKPSLANEKQKCLMMMPERFAIRCIDELGLILRNKIKWAKQILIKKEGITKGSVMPTSVKDRFNESGEELYFFVKNKKYYSNLDSVRLVPATMPSQITTPRTKSIFSISPFIKIGIEFLTALKTGNNMAIITKPFLATDKGEFFATDFTSTHFLTFGGWGNFSQSQISVNLTMAFYTDDLKIGKPISGFIIRKTTKGYEVMNLKDCFIKSNPTNFTFKIGSFKSKQSNLSPIITSVINSTSSPSGGIFTSKIDTSPSTITGEITKIVFSELGFNFNQKFIAEITFDFNGTQSSFFIRGTFGSWHKIDNFINLLFKDTTTKNKSQDKFNYRVRDAQRKAGQPQFKASEEEISKYGKGSEYEQKYGEPWDRFGKKTLKSRMDDTKNKDTKSSRTANIKKLLSEVRLGIKPNTGMDRNNHLRMKSATQPNEMNAFNEKGKNLPTVWLIGSEPHNFQKECGVDTDHFATFPQALLEIPIKFGTPENGIVLDPFMGSGTTAVAAKKLGRNYIGIELNKDYIKIAEKRLSAIPPTLFQNQRNDEVDKRAVDMG